MSLTPCSQPFGFQLSFVRDFLLCIDCVQFLYNLRGSFIISQGFRLDADGKKRQAQHVHDRMGSETQLGNQRRLLQLLSWLVSLVPTVPPQVAVLSPLRPPKENLRHSITFNVSNICWLASISHSDIYLLQSNDILQPRSDGQPIGHDNGFLPQNMHARRKQRSPTKFRCS